MLQVFAFLPLRSYGLKFVVQADFVVPSSREALDSDSRWNQMLRAQVPRLFVSALQAFLQAESHAAKSQPQQALAQKGAGRGDPIGAGTNVSHQGEGQGVERLDTKEDVAAIQGISCRRHAMLDWWLRCVPLDGEAQVRNKHLKTNEVSTPLARIEDSRTL